MPEVFMAGGHLCLRYGGGWIVVRSPNVTRVVWRIGFSHLADALSTRCRPSDSSARVRGRQSRS